MSPAAAVDCTSEHRRYPTGVVAKQGIYIVAIGWPKLMLHGKVAGHLTDLRGEVAPIILALFELFHSPVELEQFPGPLRLVFDLLPESLCEKVSTSLHEQDFKAQHIKALLKELNVEVLHLAAGEATVHGCHVFSAVLNQSFLF